MPQPQPAPAVDHDITKHSGAQMGCQHGAVGMLLGEFSETQPASPQPETVASVARAGSRRRPASVASTGRRTTPAPCASRPAPPAAVCAATAAGRRSSMISHSCAGHPGRRHHRLGGLAKRCRLQRLKGQREVVALVHRRRGQHVVAVRGRLVDVQVDADHQVQLAKRGLRVRRRWAPTAPGCRRSPAKP